MEGFHPRLVHGTCMLFWHLLPSIFLPRDLILRPRNPATSLPYYPPRRINRIIFKTIDQAAGAGANMIVAGSSVFKASDARAAMDAMRASVVRLGHGGVSSQ